MTLVEMMAALAVIGGLIALVVPSFTNKVQAAKVVEANAELERLAKAAHTTYRLNGKFTEGTSMTLPGAVGANCYYPDKKFPVSAMWAHDLHFATLDFAVTQPTRFAYRYESVDGETATITAIADLDCDGKLTEYKITVEAFADDQPLVPVVASYEQAPADFGDTSGSSGGGGSDTGGSGDTGGGSSGGDTVATGGDTTGGTTGDTTGSTGDTTGSTGDTTGGTTGDTGTTTGNGNGNGNGGGGGGGGGGSTGGGKK